MEEGSSRMRAVLGRKALVGRRAVLGRKSVVGGGQY